jgi:hypothetical protein
MKTYTPNSRMGAERAIFKGFSIFLNLKKYSD